MTIKVPPPAKRSTKGEPPARLAESARAHAPGYYGRNLKKPEPGRLVGLNFKVSAEFKRDFKIEAATQGLNQVELLHQLYAFWKQHQA